MLLLIGLALPLAWKLRPRVPFLPEIATEVIPKGRYYRGPFAWLSNEEYFCFGADGRTLSRYRLGSGVGTPLAERFDASSKGGDIQPSPDGKWLLWNMETEPPEDVMAAIRIRTYLTRLSDKHTQQLNDSGSPTGQFDYWVQWEPDSRHLLDVYPTPQSKNKANAVVRDAVTNRVTQKIPFAPNVPSIEGETILVTPDRLLNVSPMRSPFREETAPVEITEYRLDKTLYRVQKWSVLPPHHPTVKEAKLSPTGDRVAWLISVEYVDPTLVQLHRLLPFIKAPSQQRQELWISRPDGKEMHALGQVPIKVSNDNSLPLSDLHWLPDGKHLSFAYDHALWNVPAK